MSTIEYFKPRQVIDPGVFSSNVKSERSGFLFLFGKYKEMHGNAQISPKQEQAIMLLLEGNSLVDTAEQCRINEGTIRRWQKEAAFQEAFTEARKRVLDESFTHLQLRFNKAVDTLNRHLDASDTIPRDQVKAAEVIVDRTIQIAKLTERIAELETELLAIRQEQEQEQQDIVKFDLRKLTKEERDTLKVIDANITARDTSTNQE
jgi:hypothetical protein